MTDPVQVFRELREHTPEQHGRSHRAFDGPPGLQLRVFIDGATRLPGIAFGCPRSAVPDGWTVPKMKGANFVVQPVSLESGYAHAGYELTATDKSFAPVFIELACTLIAQAGAEQTAQSALLLIVRKVAAWARFFDARGPSALGRSAQLGLIGELLCLKELAPLIGWHQAIPAWTGPTGTTHDFQFPAASIEAKLTTSGSPERLRITSARQLDEAPLPWLGLFAVLCNALKI